MKSNFKIIAIRPLKYCNHKYLKVLNKNEIYYFYQDYQISKKEDFDFIEYKESVISGLFNLTRENDEELNINVSAIVGKNGSGKSSIIELLFRAINNIACKYKNLNHESNTIKANLQNVKGIHVEFYIQTDVFLKIEVNYKKIKIYSFQNGLQNSQPEKMIDLKNLFYTEAVNYSHYGYNSHEFGNWLKELFHKNDSYQTPLVLNPMRTDGNIDINSENDLINQRLLVNLLRKDNEHFIKFGDNLKAVKLVFALKEIKRSVHYHEKLRENKYLKKEIKLNVFYTKKDYIISLILEKYSNIIDFKKEKINYDIYNRISYYLLYKLISISVKYSEYDKFKSIFLIEEKDPFNKELFIKYLEELKKDSSHISFKFNQTINYLLNLYLEKKYFSFSELTKEYSLSDLASDIDSIKEKNQSIIELLPPPIFKTEIVLQRIKRVSEIEEEFIEFQKLSSGEKQLIYSVSSILYHLYNIDSVSDNKIQYKNINIVFEEIELYFHPEMQKSFIKYLLDSINRIDLKNIESINICFITHSPFILSDIPCNNIMFLEVVNGKSIQKKGSRKTFGANIHELLSDNFFMSNGFIGDFAKDKIDKTIDWLNKELLNKRKFENENSQEKYRINDEVLKFHKGIISLIDEPIIRIKLSEMLSEIDDNDNFYDNIIREQIKYLEDSLMKKKQ